MGNIFSMNVSNIVDIENNYILKPAKIKNRQKFGKDGNFYFVIEFNISEDDIGDDINLGNVMGKCVFENYSPFICGVSFTCSKTSAISGKSHYADPTSHWYNVFYGFYEFNCDCKNWKRPFCFTEEGKLYIVDILKMMKGMWNILGNYVYGVPLPECLSASTITGEEELTILSENVPIGDYSYTEITLENVSVISGYPCHEKLLSPYDEVSVLWRKLFGTCDYVKGYDTPFPMIKMKGHFFIRYEHSFDKRLGAFVFKTYIAGGSINLDYPGDKKFNEEFLGEQLQSIKSCLETHPFSRK